MSNSTPGWSRRLPVARTREISFEQLIGVRSALGDLSFPFDFVGADLSEHRRDQLMIQLDNHLLARREHPDAPMLAVIGGPTGSGKSTLVNSLFDAELAHAGVLRPTTRTPVVIYHPADEDNLGAYLDDLSLGFADGREIRLDLVKSNKLRPGIALVDAPDIDSIDVENRMLAAQLLGAADMWIFVTTANRYSDRSVWEALGDAASRGVAVCAALNRVDPRYTGEVKNDLAQLLREAGMGSTPLFVIPDCGPHTVRLTEDVVAAIRNWIFALGGDAHSREMIARRTREGAMKWLPRAARDLDRDMEEHIDRYHMLRKAVEEGSELCRTALINTAMTPSVFTERTAAIWDKWKTQKDDDILSEVRNQLASDLSDSIAIELLGANPEVDRIWDVAQGFEVPERVEQRITLNQLRKIAFQVVHEVFDDIEKLARTLTGGTGVVNEAALLVLATAGDHEPTTGASNDVLEIADEIFDALGDSADTVIDEARRLLENCAATLSRVPGQDYTNALDDLDIIEDAPEKLRRALASIIEGN
ncbi:50S ribosome-binding GTPase [Micrococcales bacterium 31B]|nr:50S ribosome-binding GTPase [Micrococcales bacterium 31B]